MHALIERLAPDGIAVSAVSYMETQQGIGRNPHPQDTQTRFDELLEWIPIIAFAPTSSPGPAAPSYEYL